MLPTPNRKAQTHQHLLLVGPAHTRSQMPTTGELQNLNLLHPCPRQKHPPAGLCHVV